MNGINFNAQIVELQDGTKAVRLIWQSAAGIDIGLLLPAQGAIDIGEMIQQAGQEANSKLTIVKGQ